MRDLAIDPETRRVWLSDSDFHFTVREFDLLLALSRNPTRVATREELLRAVRGFRSAGRTRHRRHAREPPAAGARRGGRQAIRLPPCLMGDRAAAGRYGDAPRSPGRSELSTLLFTLSSSAGAAAAHGQLGLGNASRGWRQARRPE
ncbi:MAG: winged helix-turn-helix transcriptional regulator [Actinobacteria bacterium]|nr:winged helix-turn-helix transcriptional regulator [Actinomycetota bacterium]